MKYASIVLLAVLSFGCDNLFNDDDSVAVVNDPPKIKLLNHTNSDVYYMVVPSDLLARANFQDPCINFQPNLESNQILEIPYKDISEAVDTTISISVRWTNCKSNWSGTNIDIAF